MEGTGEDVKTLVGLAIGGLNHGARWVTYGGFLQCCHVLCGDAWGLEEAEEGSGKHGFELEVAGRRVVMSVLLSLVG